MRPTSRPRSTADDGRPDRQAGRADRLPRRQPLGAVQQRGWGWWSWHVLSPRRNPLRLLTKPTPHHLSRPITRVMLRNMSATGSPALSRRERARHATLEEIKSTALALMREQGTTDVRFTDIARVMGMTPPALYRYFADRDELLTALITDAYGHLGATVATARDSVPEDDLAGRWVAAATAYRDWAKSEPQQFALILGLPVPGYVAPQEGPTSDAAKEAMAQLADLFIRAANLGRLGRPLLEEVSPDVVSCAHDKHPELDGIVPPESFQA